MLTCFLWCHNPADVVRGVVAVKTAIAYPSDNVESQKFAHSHSHCRLTSSDKIEVTRMHKIALEPNELYKLWADDRGATVEEVDLGRRDHTYVLLNSVLPCGTVSQPVGGS